MSTRFTERATVQRPMTKYAAEIGWNLITQEEALTLREGETGLLFRSVLRDQLLALNPSVVTGANVDDIIKRIEGVPNSIEGNEEVLEWIRGNNSIYVDAEKREVNVRVVDFAKPSRNRFQVTEEWEYTNGKFTNRADVAFLVNGIPVALAETKAPHEARGIDEGWKQIRRYHAETPELMTLPQLFDLTHLIQFYYGATWSLDRRGLFNWKDVEPGNFEKKVKHFFDRDRFLRVLRDYIAFVRKDDTLTKMILAQYQVRAVEKVLDRVADPSKHRALVWHTQGSGKTVTMITVARQLLSEPHFGKPTVLMVVDRNELEGQLFRELEAHAVEHVVAESKKHLQELLSSGYCGLIVSMIHKFEGVPQDINKSPDVVVLVDEAHRTTGGDLGNYLMGALPNATYIGFTGTPIDRTAHGQGTFKTFGTEDPQGYLDKYSIAESIEDGTTLRLRYQMAPNEMQVPRELLEREFLALAEAEGVSDIEELNRILDRAVNLKEFLKSKDRVDQVARFVAEHYRSNVEPLGYKAFLVGVDRQACALYKEALDKYLPAEYSTVVYTAAHNDSAELKKHYIAEADEKDLRKDFRKPEKLPKILIVTEKLLTGFDAPILYAMYLDKPMRDHTLLQAIARVNRPYDDGRKPSGFVLDFVGVFENVQKALAFDSDDVSGVIENIEVLKERFKSLMDGEVREYLGLANPQLPRDKAAEVITDRFADKAEREKFARLFRELETLYEILSPDPFLRDYIERYQQIAEFYALLVSAYNVGQPPGLIDLMSKTQALVREHVTTEGLDKVLPIYEIDEHTLDALRKDGSSESTKIVNLARSLILAAQKEGNEQPFLIPIGERAEEILSQFQDRQIATGDAMRQLAELVKDRVAAHQEMESKKYDMNTFSIYYALRRVGIAGADELAPKLNEVFLRYPEYRENADERRDLLADLYKVLLKSVPRPQRAALVEEILKTRRS